jgi:hypothetical protein
MHDRGASSRSRVHQHRSTRLTSHGQGSK